MVMTSQMWHLMFEPVKENEYIYVLNGIRKQFIKVKDLQNISTRETKKMVQ